MSFLGIKIINDFYFLLSIIIQTAMKITYREDRILNFDKILDLE